MTIVASRKQLNKRPFGDSVSISPCILSGWCRFNIVLPCGRRLVTMAHSHF